MRNPRGRIDFASPLSRAAGTALTMATSGSIALHLDHYGRAAWRRVLRLAERFDQQPLIARWLYQPGPPPGLKQEVLHEVVERAGYGRCSRVGHRHISGWKDAGAYRVSVGLADGRVLRLVHKNALYKEREFPALEGLGRRPGHGEYAVYRSLAGPTARFLPTVLFAEELEPERHYSYLMADLMPEYRMCSSRPADLIKICAVLPELHAELQILTDRHIASSLVAFDHAFTLQLLAYAKEALVPYAAMRPNSEVASLVSDWEVVANAYRRGADLAYSCQPMILIHGDYNPNNVMLCRRGDHLKAIDFEWFGWGLPQMDLASALKGAAASLREDCAARFARRDGAASPAEERCTFEFCVLQRALFDAAFIAKQLPRLPAKARASFERILLRSASRARTSAAAGF